MASSPVASQPPQRGFALAAWLPTRRALLWVAGAFALGLILFVLVWKSGSDDKFYRAGPIMPSTDNPQYAPLPAPISSDDGPASDVAPSSERSDSGEEHPRLVETAPPAPPPSPSPVASAAAPIRPVPVLTSQPQPISAPAPAYPAQALRRGDQGTVMVNAQVDANGVPSQVEVAKSSGSRVLDRAATDAVRRWRFRPAMANGQPTSGEVQVPISFKN